ncbi:YidB family protein [Aliirhizobium terrae]|uniref:YidB family protein n=1 Tax=Terrirhizobium terrae TaxID=2926709 RepID=UPI00257611D1|nr:YidB family protein [Rhizobium sp. CC-CFT758]WJH41929.1 YidB family protein [Rhizobium sp. CC-CFT758]
MASGSLKALLAVLAVAGYQNRDKIGEFIKRATEGGMPQPNGGGGQAASPGSPFPGQTSSASTGQSTSGSGMPGLDDILGGLTGGLGGLGGSSSGGLGGLGSILGGAGLGSILNGGLTDLVDQFRQAGQGQKADSWVNTGANEPIEDSDLQQALGPDVLREIAEKTGLSEDEVLQRLAKSLPDAVDGLTPNGMIPPERRAL